MAGPWESFQQPQTDPKAGPWSDFHPETGEPMSWGDVASSAVSNLPGSAYNLGANIVHTLAHPIDAVTGLYDVGKGAVSKAEGAIGIQQDPEQKAKDEASINAVRDFFVNRYGSMDQFKKTLSEDPAGVMMDISTLFTGPELALSRLPGAVGKVGEISGKVADLTNPVSLAGKAVANVAEPIVSNILGETTGAGATPIRQAAKAGYAGSTTFADNMRGKASLTDTIDMAKGAVGQMRQDRNAAYKSGMVDVKGDAKWMSYQPIFEALKDAEGKVYFNGFPKSPDAAAALDKVKSLVAEWRNAPPKTIQNPDGSTSQVLPQFTPEGMDALKQAIGEIKTDPNTLERTIVSGVYNAARSTLAQQVPKYDQVMKDYSNASDQIKELEKTFSLGEKVSKDTTLRKLQSTTRNNVNTNYGQRAKLVDELAKYEPELPNALAGQALNTATPRGMAARTAVELGGIGAGAAAMHFINPAFLASLPFFSPRIVGEGAYAAGRIGNALEPFANALPAIAQGGYVVNALAPRGISGGIGPRYDENGNLRPGQ